MKQKNLFIAALVALLVVFAGGAFYYKAQQQDAAKALADANRAALMRMHSPTLGPADAPVVIVEFLDPACETCSAFYPLVKGMMASNPEQIRLVLRYAPFHNGSDKVVAVLEAARKQGKLWPALEALLVTQADWSPHHTPQVSRVWKHLEGLGLDFDQMAIDINAPEITRIIEQDLADAKTLNVTKTPEFFVNGKPLPSFGYRQLQQLVDDALSQSQRQ